jgi:NitT/TauT family transport system ATP-binding protein
MNVIQRSGAEPRALVNGARRDMADWGGTAIRLTDVSKVYGRGQGAVHAIDRLTLSVGNGEFVCLVGASGCGKSTLLSIVAGLDSPTAGEVDTSGRRVAMIFQEPALFPWLTARRNVELALRARRVPREQRQQRSAELLETVHLAEFADKRPHELSGGMRQRVALARAIVIKPGVLLFDEPLSNLDAKLRVSMRGEIRSLQQRLGITTVYVTHDQEEAMAISDRIAVMDMTRARLPSSRMRKSCIAGRPRSSWRVSLGARTS